MSHDPATATADPRLAALRALISSRERAPFAWGGHDCCLFAADAVLAMTGTDHAARWRGTYSDAASAARVLAEIGGIRAVGALSGRPIAPMAARVGDLGLLQHQGRELLAVCSGAMWLCPAAPAGLAAHDLPAAVAAWRVGHA